MRSISHILQTMPFHSLLGRGIWVRLRKWSHGLIASVSLSALASTTLTSCLPEPPLHLYEEGEATFDIPVVDLDLQVYWDYELAFGISYDWQMEWYYHWDEEDKELFGELGYTEPEEFNIRRYYTGSTPYTPHTSVLAASLRGKHFVAKYEWGFWDLLVWNQVETIDGVQSLNFDETTSLDSVVAYTNQSMRLSRFNAPRYTRSFYSPEPLFSAYDQGIEINRNLDGFVYDPIRNVYVKTLNMMLYPITYIYLPQIIIHNNHGRIAAIDGSGDLSSMARSATLNTGYSGSDAITVTFNTRMKKDQPLIPYSAVTGRSETVSAESVEHVDIIGGRLMTFGIPENNPNRAKSAADIHDKYRHYMDITMQFNNGIDSTFVFDVTDQVRRKYKGGVITIELDMDTVPIPTRRGGSGFDAVVKDFEDGGTWEFDM